MTRATPNDLRDLEFEMNMRQIAGPCSGIMIMMLRRIGRERGIMTHIESVAGEYADLFSRDPDRIDGDLDRPRLVVIEGTRDAVNDDNVPPSPEAA